MPLPPYIRASHRGKPAPDDRICYQTEYARQPGAVAAPTAGLHFTKPLLDELKTAGVEVAALTLHVGYGTFAPLRCSDIRRHRMHSEFIEIGEQTACAVNRAKRENRRVVAVGTTVVRTLEWVYEKKGIIAPFSGMCDHYIYAGPRLCGCRLYGYQLPSPQVQPHPSGERLSPGAHRYLPPTVRRSARATASSATEMGC